MITYKVGKEPHGWAVRIGAHMVTPFWSKAAAVRRANGLAAAMRVHGQAVEVLIESEVGSEIQPDLAYGSLAVALLGDAANDTADSGEDPQTSGASSLDRPEETLAV